MKLELSKYTTPLSVHGCRRVKLKDQIMNFMIKQKQGYEIKIDLGMTCADFWQGKIKYLWNILLSRSVVTENIFRIPFKMLKNANGLSITLSNVASKPLIL